MNKGELTKRQQLILDFIRVFHAANMYPPTIREIGRGIGVASTSVVNYNLDKLRDAGWINRDGRVSRGLQLVHKPVRRIPARGALVTVPLAGRIFAGVPVPMPAADASFAPDETIDLPRSMVGDAEDLFALQVRGDSMIDAMVSNGDIVVMKRTQIARNGDLVAVWLRREEETTLKHFFVEPNGRVRLQPANPTMKPIYAQAKNVEVQGRVVLVLRQPRNGARS